MTLRRLWVAIAAVVTAMVVLAVAGYALHSARVPTERSAATVFAVGDCVTVPSSPPDTLRATEVPCGVDPSYTVGATTDGSGACPSAEYQQLPAQFADPSTSRLCLVPNLVADHCYLLNMPVGMLERADCSDRGRGVLVQVTRRLDSRDQHACPFAQGHFAWPYPSPARTYCTLTLY